MADGQVTEAQVLDVLRAVQEPGGSGDLVAGKRVEVLTVSGDNVVVGISLPNLAGRDEVERAVTEAIRRIPGVQQVSVRFAAPPPRKGSGDLLPGVAHVIAVASGKGGVGKSTVASNIATALAQDGFRVGLLDADIYGPSIPMMMGVRQPPAVRAGKMLPIDRHGVKLMSLGFLMPDDATPVVWRGPMVGGAVRQMLGDCDWGELDYLLVDLPPGTGDAQLTLSQSVPLEGAVIVMTSQDVAVNIASKALAMMQKLNVPVLGVVENMSSFVCPHCQQETPIFTRGGGLEAAARLEVPFLGAVPLDPSIVDHGDQGTPTVIAAPESAQADAFRKVARTMVERVDALTASDADQAPMLGGLTDRFRK